jgi:hypothetical protein
MGCPGLHCPGCSEGQSLGVVALAVLGLVVADEMCTWVADRIFWIGGTVAACFILATAASMWLERLSDARCARFGERRGIASRADVEALTPAGIAWLERHEQPQVSSGTAPLTIELHQHHHYYGAVGPEPLRVIRTTALPGQPGVQAITEE